MKQKNNLFILISICLGVALNAQTKKDPYYNAITEFRIYSENKSYYGYYDTTKISEVEIRNFYNLITLFVSDDYTLEKAIKTLGRNLSDSNDPFNDLYKAIIGDTAKSTSKYIRKYKCDKLIEDSTYISGLKFKDSKWTKRKNEVLKYYSKLKNSVEIAIDEVENTNLIKYKGKKDTCFKIVKILNSKDTLARFDLWENYWGKAYRARVSTLDLDWSSKNIASLVERLDYWAKFDIYSYVYWQNCSEFHELFDDYEFASQIHGGKVIESKSGIVEYKKLFYKLEEIKER